MPAKYKQPGVYINELPSGSHTIVPTSTSTTAFIGRAKWGPVNEPVTIFNFADFQNIFGGLWSESNLGYSVFDFFNHGGSQACIVRLFKETTTQDSPTSKAQITIGDLKFEAANPGSWGERLSVEIDFEISQQLAGRFGLDKEKMFNLSVKKTDDRNKITSAERYLDLTIEDLKNDIYHNNNRVDKVLEGQSMLLKYKPKEDFPKDLKSVKALAENGIVSYSVKESMESLQKRLDELKDDEKEKKKTLTKELTALQSSDGELLDADCFIGEDREKNREGLYAFENIEPKIFNLMCIPPYNPDDVDPEVIGKAAGYCEKKKAFLIVDSPSSWKTVEDAESGLHKLGTDSPNAAIYLPRIINEDPLTENNLREFAPSGAIAGIIASDDNTRGVWKAPAGAEAELRCIKPSILLNDQQNGILNPLGINCIRQFDLYGSVVWGARTLQGADILSSEWKYINVRRLALYIEQSIEQGLKWVVFEPNDENLWNAIRLSVDSFLQGLFHEGAFPGRTQDESYIVRVDSTTTSQRDIERGVVNLIVGIAPALPAEYIVLTFELQVGCQK